MALARPVEPADLVLPRPAEATRATWRVYLRRWAPIGVGLAIAVAMIAIAAAAPYIAPLSPSAQYSDAVLKAPGANERHLLGTDDYGRDILSRIIWGARISLQVGLASVVFGFVIGVPLGIYAGYRGARTETVIMRATDMLMAFPTLLLALIIVTALGGSLFNEMLAIGIALTPNFLRLARSLTLTIREHDYILAARGLGAGPLRVMARHVFPNALYALVVVATLYIATAIRTEASLSISWAWASRRRPRAGATSSARGGSTSSAAPGSRRSQAWRSCWRCWRSTSWGTP